MTDALQSAAETLKARLVAMRAEFAAFKQRLTS